jgi:hypothetical protein
VADEGVRPRLIVEVVSPAYRANDVTGKVDHYHRAEVPYYVIVDREAVEGPVTVRGYRWTKRRYRPLTADPDGWLWIEPLALWLAARDNRVVAFDGNSEEEIGNYAEVTARLDAERLAREQAEAQAADERRRADEAVRRAEAAEAELARLRALLGQAN